MRRNLVFSLIIIFLLLLPEIVAAKSADSQSFYFLTLTDIHFDPFSACYAGYTGKTCPVIDKLRAAPASEWQHILAAQDKAQPAFNRDTGYVLLQNSLLEAAASANQHHPGLVFVLGDTLVHEFRFKYKKYSRDASQAGYRHFVLKTLEFLNIMLRQTFPAQDVVMTVGNNDTYSKNYYSEPGGAFFHDAGSLWSSLLLDSASRQHMQKQFSAAGYYAIDLPRHPQIRLIVLNSVLFSKKVRDVTVEVAARLEWNWLHQELQRAKDNHQQVLLTLHIPPTLNLDLMQRINLFDAHQFFRNDDLQRFQQELSEYYPQIAGIITGHLHYEWQQWFSVGNRRRLLIISVPSISPVFGNDPSFKVFHYTPAVAKVDSVYTYTYPLKMSTEWRESYLVY